MGLDAGKLENVWSQHNYPAHITFVGQWEQQGFYFRVLRDGDTLLIQGLYPALGKGAQTTIALQGRHPDSEIVHRTVMEAALMMMGKFKELEAKQYGN